MVLGQELLGIDATRWLAGLAILALALAILGFMRDKGVRRFRALADKTDTKIDDVFVELAVETRWWFLILLATYFGSLALNLQGAPKRIVWHVFVIALVVQGGLWGSRLIAELLNLARDKAPADASQGGVSVLGLIGRIALWATLVVILLSNFGVDVTALVTGLGIGAVAVALAVQNVLGDLLASLSIIFDRPFQIGDFISVDGMMGTVEKIGVKTTHIRSLGGELLIFPNSDLVKSRIRNHEHLTERRVLFTIGVRYETPPDKLKRLSGLLREIVEKQEKVRFDRAHFATYGDFSLIFEVVYFVLDPDYVLFMDTQQRVNLEILERLAAEGITLAYPTRTVYLSNSPATT